MEIKGFGKFTQAEQSLKAGNRHQRDSQPDACGTAVSATVGVKLEEFSDILTSLDYFEGTL